MKTTLKNQFIAIGPDGDFMFNTISEHRIVTETCLQVHTNWSAEKSKEKGFIIANVDIKFSKAK